jgi:molecular chaperone GrpE
MAESDKKNQTTQPEAGAKPQAPGPAPEAAEDKKTDKKAAKPRADAGKLAALEQQLADEKKKSGKLNDNLLRTAADYDNYRRRSQKEFDAAFGNGVAHAAEQLLPVLDTLEAAANAPTADEEYKKGVLLILAKAAEVFKKLGITEIDALGKPFDPELHNACLQEDCEGVESGAVTKVMQKGYTLNGRVIRHAVVAVSS